MIRYEVAHDVIARQVFDKASAEAKARRKVEGLVARALERFRERGVLLSREDLDEIRPHEQNISWTAEEEAFIAQSRQVIEAAARRRRRITLGIIATLTIFLLIALAAWQQARRSAEAQRRMRLAVQARAALDDGYPSLSFRLAEAAYPGGDSTSRAFIQGVIEDLAGSGLQAELDHGAPIRHADFSADEQRILTVSADGTLRLWNNRGEQLKDLSLPPPLTGAAFLPWDGSIMAAAEKSLHHLGAGGEPIGTMAHPALIRILRINAPRQRILSVDEENTLRIYTGEGTLIQAFPFQDSLLNLEVSPNGNYLLLVFPRRVEARPLEFAERGFPITRFTLELPVQEAHFVQSDHLQLQTIVVSNDTARVYNDRGEWDQESYYLYLNSLFQQFDHLKGFAFSPPGSPYPKTLFITRDSIARVWSAYRLDTQRRRKGELDFQVSPNGHFTYAGFSATGQYCVTAEADAWIKFYDIRQEEAFAFRFRERTTHMLFSGSDRFLLTHNGQNTAMLRDLTQRKKTVDWVGMIRNNYPDRLRPLTKVEKKRYHLR